LCGGRYRLLGFPSNTSRDRDREAESKWRKTRGTPPEFCIRRIAGDKLSRSFWTVLLERVAQTLVAKAGSLEPCCGKIS
jgi:hypothetical protein